MKLEEVRIVQGDGSNPGNDGLLAPKLYAIYSGKRHLVRHAQGFRAAGYNRSAVLVISDDELERLPLAEVEQVAPGEEIILDLDSNLGAGHFMTTHGVLRKGNVGAHVDAITRTRTITWFGGYHGGVNMLYSDAGGFPVGMSETHRFGVDGTWIGNSDRTDYWSEELSEDIATRTTTITLFHFWQPDRLDDVVRRGFDLGKPVVEIIADIAAIGGSGKSS